jgi:hypothetical protein
MAHNAVESGTAMAIGVSFPLFAYTSLNLGGLQLSVCAAPRSEATKAATVGGG